MQDVGIYICIMSIWYIYRHLVYIRDIWYILVMWYFLWTFGIFCGNFVYFVLIRHIFAHFGMLYQERSGNPASDRELSVQPPCLCA
jgi:hypothetical protein